MKTYTLRQAIEKNLLPWSVKTILRMKDRGEINLIDIAQGKRTIWAVTDAEIKRVMMRYHKGSINKMVEPKDLKQS